MQHFIHFRAARAECRKMCLCLERTRIALLVLAMLLSWADACYFPIELQGEYVVQVTTNTPGNLVQYSQVNISAEAIPIWGHCHRRLGNRFILTDSSGGANCSRCFHIILRSRNVLQVRTEGLDKCYTNQDAAEATCPDEKTANQSDISKAIVFYKTKEVGGEDIKQVYCPINGRFNFVYTLKDGSINNMKCRDPVSEMDNCPSGSDLNLHFHNCDFPNKDVTFQCLGHWSGPGDQNYLALRDTSFMSQHQLPPYRCALYKEEAGTGNVFMAFSSDSTCSSNLDSAMSGYEMFSLSVVPSIGWPSQVDNSNCRFPPWARGYWQHIYIEGNTLTYKDHSTFKTYTIRCLGPEAATSERFAVFARTQCGEEMYTCIWLKRRGVNVLEFQLGLQSSTYYNSTLCSDSNFEPKVWITQGRMERLEESPCPVAGEYAGIIPDATNLCARLSSDCRSPEIMYYTVSDCSHSEIYEEREYRCLGQWKEDGLMYTYTQRRDVGTYECFVGSIVSNNEIYIKEAGDHCQRNIDPMHYGMKLTKKGSCIGNPPGSVSRPGGGEMPQPRPTTSWMSSRRPPEPTQPWKPITAPPRDASSAETHTRLTPLQLLLVSIIVYFVYRQ
ncbi:hypothetical protein L9F63_024210 [Diploptera punctata]|uniref:Uncharacterized protein n=1 Tax=Diploptera punctata TaxID=6984 RepID=A0AAD7ZH65_DIPPU|nr:hypothetical protein L9F63_024210 [Diploptera punctata]